MPGALRHPRRGLARHQARPPGEAGVRRAAIVALSLVAAACTTTPPDPDADRAFDGIEIAPYGIHESCLKLASGDRLDAVLCLMLAAAGVSSCPPVAPGGVHLARPRA